MSDETSGKMPRYVDSQQQVFWWELDEFLGAMLIFSIGIIIGKWMTLVGIVGAYAFVKFLRMWKEGELEGAMPHIMFSWGVIGLNALYTDALQKDFYE